MAVVSPLAPARFPALAPIAGVRLAAFACGIRYTGRYDLMLAELAPGSAVAGVFTAFTWYGLNSHNLSTGNQIGKPPTGGTRSRFVGVVSYKSKMITLAGLYSMTTDSVTGAAAEVKGQVLSAFGVYHFSNSPVAVLLRFDHIKPNKDAASTVPGFASFCSSAAPSTGRRAAVVTI